MSFNKLENKENAFYITRRKPFLSEINLNHYVKKVFDFVYGMTFGKTGHHRSFRTGGQYERKNGELFINAFQGKLAEFGVYEKLKANGIISSLPDLEQWGEGVWDDEDLIVSEKHISIKSTVYFGNLLLLEQKDWNSLGQYIPNLERNIPDSDYFLLTRISPDGKKIMREKRWMYSMELDKNELLSMISSQNWNMDIPGFISKDELKELIKNEFILPQNSLLNGRTKMDANNIYVQAGDLNSIDELIKIISE